MPNYQIDPVIKHRREVRRQILLPVILPTLLLLVIIGLIFGLTLTGTMDAGQVSVISSIMLMICVLCPAFITFLIIDLIFIGMAWGTGKIPAAVKPLIRSVRHLTEFIAEIAENLSTIVARPFMRMEMWFTRQGAFWKRLAGGQIAKEDNNERSTEE